MIQITDSDQPIDVAQKIITGTKTVALSPAQKALRGALLNDKSSEFEFDMFTLDEIKEIIDYLTVYYNAHKEGPDAAVD